MRSYDFSPFYRSSIGFDRMLDLLGAPARGEAEEAWPPYDIERLGEDRYRITVAAAGFAREDFALMAEPNALLIEGRRGEEEAGRHFLHRGVSQRAFRLQFDLADFVKVTGAAHENGLLSIELEREIPEAMKPRRIEIAAAARPEVSHSRAAVENPA